MMRRLGIVGLGLIGGSIGLGARKLNLEVWGFDTNPVHADVALARGCVSRLASSVEELPECDLVVLATPPDAIPGILSRLDSGQCCATDVAGVKQWVVEQVPVDWRARFVPGHPMAGLETSGPEAAREDLFHGAAWAWCPHVHQSEEAIRKVTWLIEALGAAPVRVEPGAHDWHAGLLSHVPHVLAAALLTEARTLRYPELAGGSWRDLTRVGAAEPHLWSQLLAHNSEAVSELLRRLETRLSGLRAALARDDAAFVREFFEEAQRPPEQP